MLSLPSLVWEKPEGGGGPSEMEREKKEEKHRLAFFHLSDSPFSPASRTREKGFLSTFLEWVLLSTPRKQPNRNPFHKRQVESESPPNPHCSVSIKKGSKRDRARRLLPHNVRRPRRMRNSSGGLFGAGRGRRNPPRGVGRDKNLTSVVSGELIPPLRTVGIPFFGAIGGSPPTNACSGV